MMRTSLRFKLFILVIAIGNFSYADERSYKFFFTPRDSIINEINTSIRNSRRHIWVAASKLSNKQLIAELNLVILRGIFVQIIVDSDSTRETNSQLALLAKRGACIYIDGNHKTFHNKYIVIDDNLVITGSYNYTRDSEERNAENVVFMTSSSAVSAYLADWNSHLQHSILLSQDLSPFRCAISN